MMTEEPMSDSATAAQYLQQLLAGDLPPDKEREMVAHLLETQPNLSTQLAQLYLHHKLRLQKSLAEETIQHKRLRDVLQQAPWVHYTFVKLLPGTPPRAAVLRGPDVVGFRIHPDLDPASLTPGQTAFVSEQQQCVVGAGPIAPPASRIGTFQVMIGSQALIQQGQEEQSLMDLLDPSLASTLRPGDTVTYHPVSHLVLNRVWLPPASMPDWRLEEAPAVSFKQIGGMDDVVDRLTQEIRLQVFHRAIVDRHQLPLRKGLLLYGPPGCGKTLLAKSVARYVADLEGVESRFLLVKAGSHRSMWYGESEANLRKIFTLARRAARAGQFVTMLFDDFDHFGSREAQGQDVDTRVLPALLHEIDGLQDVANVFLIGVTNRPDLLDDALLRPGRFGDRPFFIPRPHRAASEAIFSIHLADELPYGPDLQGELRQAAIDRLLSRIYAPMVPWPRWGASPFVTAPASR
jgi:proteasome-associated ATPase